MKYTEATSNGYGAFFAHTKGVSVSGLVKIDVENAAHAINHVDAIVDALDALVSDYNQYRAINGIDLTDDHCAKLDVKMATAEAALSAYRGEK